MGSELQRLSTAVDASAWRLLAALGALNVLSYVDRQLVAALAPLLIADLGLSRAQVGLLLGASFIVVFGLVTLGMGVLADRWSRTRLIAGGLAGWSTATALTGTASGLLPLALWRSLVGVGEATLSPAALALLGERFPAARLGLASSVFYAGIPLGFACSFALAAWLAPWLGWRVCFVALGAVGLVASGLVLAVRDERPTPRRDRGSARPATSALRRALAAEPALRLLVGGGALLAYASASSQHTITWLVQERGFPYARAAWLSAAVIATAGLGGNVGLGLLTDRARRRSPRARLLALAVLGAVGLSLAAAFYVLPPRMTVAFYACWMATQAWMLGWYGPLFAAVQELSPADARATAIGFALLAVNLLGVATGPWLTGLIGDRAGLTHGLLASVLVGGVGVLLVLAAALRTRERPRHPC